MLHNLSVVSLRSAASAAILIGLVIASFSESAVAAPPQPPVRVLFIGNSFTYYHELPKMLAKLAEAGGQRPLEHESVTPGGYSLEQHWKEKQALAKIRSGRWQFVVLQDQSQIPLLRREALDQYAKQFDAAIREQGATTILYQTWALQNKPAEQATISRAYADLAKQLHAQLAPVGNAWHNPRIFPTAPDGSSGWRHRDRRDCRRGGKSCDQKLL